MKPIARHAVLILTILFALFAGWRVVGQMQAERYAKTEPERALSWRPNHPIALRTLAERQLEAGQLDQAQATARQLLAHEPLQGVGFRYLAQVAEKQGRKDEAFELYRIAERRAPRDLITRAWLAQRYLEQGELEPALEQVDRILRMEPRRAGSINPVLVQLAQDPAFANALARKLATSPPWRGTTLAAFRDPKTGNPDANGRIMEALQANGGLTKSEYDRWLDSLIALGRWGEAYARWAGEAAKVGGRLPLVYNGDFGQPVSGSGFDWRQRRVPGVLLAFEHASGADGPAAYLRFLDRRVAAAGLEQPLFLSPGRYRLSAKMRAQGLRSAGGLQWVVGCVGKGGAVARLDPVNGNLPWRDFVTDFAVPAGCEGQWLRLLNPVAAGSAQRVAGELWVDDVKIVRHP